MFLLHSTCTFDLHFSYANRNIYVLIYSILSHSFNLQLFVQAIDSQISSVQLKRSLDGYALRIVGYNLYVISHLQLQLFPEQYSSVLHRIQARNKLHLVGHS